MIRRFVILGATGDLASRYLLPALARLHQVGNLSDELSIVGAAQDDWGPGAFRDHIRARLERHAADIPASSRRAVVSRLDYRRADATDPAELAKVLGGVRVPLVAYLALPPSVYAGTVRALAAVGLAEGSRVVVEKPFGEDLASAQALNRLLRGTLPETAVFRMDHFLGKQTVQNILGLRFANRVFEPLWNRNHIARVDIVWDETLALEGRATYYDSAGALRDMIQNHLLQILCLVGMEAPTGLNERDLRDRKVDVLRAVRRLSPEEVARLTVRARYGAGRIGDREVPAFVDEAGIDPTRGTETFTQVTLAIDNWRWAGVPFCLRTGKALARDRREIAVHFQPVPHLVFGQATDAEPNVLRFQLDPDRLSLTVNINGPGDPFTLEAAELDLDLAPHELPAYARLLLDVMEGDPALSIRADEAEESWRIAEPILQAWGAGLVPLGEYPAGSADPLAATEAA
jgi:glucose-6-phosphate 1-dehydrogenase